MAELRSPAEDMRVVMEAARELRQQWDDPRGCTVLDAKKVVDAIRAYDDNLEAMVNALGGKADVR